MGFKIADKVFGFLFLLSACSLTTACSEQWRDIDYQYPSVEEPEARVESHPEYIELGWTNVSDSFGELPLHINIYRSPETLQESNAIAYIAVAEPDKADWDVWSIRDIATQGTTDALMTPSEVYAAEQNPYVVINAGYFFTDNGKNYSSSLAVSESELLATNINYASEDWVTVYTPTRGALLEHADGSFEACWTYYTNDGDHYTYSEPAPNYWGETPAPVPSDSYPVEAETFEAVTAIGGGPVLVRGGEFRNTIEEEMFDGWVSGVSPESYQPRTAIGTTQKGQLILFVCEGREMTEGVKGLTTEQVARVMMELGCVEALNLDGGGSSCMLVNGKNTIQLSDGAERSVASAIFIK